MTTEPASDPGVVVVTGATRGIGAALSRHLAATGATVIAADIVDPTWHADGVDHLHVDVSDEASWAQLVATTLDRHGRIDALVNNAGIYHDLGAKRPFTEITVAEWDRVLAVNTRGVWLGIRAVHPAMERQQYGRVVNIASATVHMGVPYFAHYTASKGAVIALTRSLAREVGPGGITVNAVAPGLVETEATRVLNDDDYLATAAQRRAVPRRMVPDDLCAAVAFLCSPASAFVTGQTLIVDGGVAFS